MAVTSLLLAQSLWTEGSGGDPSGECTCEAFLPNSTFPIRELISLESTAVEINHKLEIEISKVRYNLNNSCN